MLASRANFPNGGKNREICVPVLPFTQSPRVLVCGCLSNEVSKDKLLERERYWIDFYNAYENEYHYNLSSGCCFSDMFKYDLWDVGCCHYKKGRPDGQKVFSFIYDNYRIPMGMFNDFVSVEIINRLVKEAIKER